MANTPSSWVKPNFIEVAINAECTAYAGIDRGAAEIPVAKTPAVDTADRLLIYSHQIAELPEREIEKVPCDTVQ
jgi:hypothetical protein